MDATSIHGWEGRYWTPTSLVTIQKKIYDPLYIVVKYIKCSGYYSIKIMGNSIRVYGPNINAVTLFAALMYTIYFPFFHQFADVPWKHLHGHQMRYC